MLELFLLPAYIFLFSFIILRSEFFNQFEINKKKIVAVFIVKILWGILYGYLHSLPQGYNDTWALFRQGSLQVYHVLFINPVSYFKLVFLPCSFPPPSGLEHYSYSIGAYGEESYYFLVRFNALVRLFSFGFYNVHVVFYNFVTLIGLLYLIKFTKNFINGKDNLVLISLALFPGVAFWTSGIHKDGFGLAALGLFLFSLLNILRNNFRMRNFVLLVLSLLLLAILRKFIFIILVPAAISFSWVYVKPERSILKFLLVHFLYYILLFNIQLILPNVNVLQQLVFMQSEFLKLEMTSSTIPLSVLHPNIFSFLSAIPAGILHCISRPYLWEIHSFFQLVTAVDYITLVFLTVTIFLFIRENKQYNPAFVFFCLFYIVSLFAITGILVPNLGALARYKCTGMLFWIFLLIYFFDWGKIKAIIKKNFGKKTEKKDTEIL